MRGARDLAKAWPVQLENRYNLGFLDLRSAAASELDHIRSLGSEPDLILATANLGAYEALLQLIAAGDEGMPVYKLVTGIQSRYASQSGIIARLRAMRDRGLIEDRPGQKKSQVCLAPSEQFLRQLGPILTRRMSGFSDMK
jgi:hypothetical protein